MVRFLQRAASTRIPGLNAEVEAALNRRPHLLQPRRVPGDAPLAIHFQDTAELAIGRAIALALRLGMVRRTNRQISAESLMPAFILTDEKLGFAQRAFKIRKQVRYRLCIVPHMRAAADTAAAVVVASFKTPETAVFLSQDRWRFEDGQVCRNGLDHLRGQRSVIECIPERGALIAQLFIVAPPITHDGKCVFETPGIPGRIGRVRGTLVAARLGSIANWRIRRIPAVADRRLRHVPRHHESNGFFTARFKCEGNME